MDFQIDFFFFFKVQSYQQSLVVDYAQYFRFFFLNQCTLYLLQNHTNFF